jgi:hypothetical protein
MRLHTSPSAIATVHSVEQPEEPLHKPAGFWWATGTSWLRFCASNYQQKLHPVHYAVELVPAANIVRLASTAEVADFVREYGGDPEYDGWSPVPGIRRVRWAEVARLYQGIEIDDPRAHARNEDRWLEYWDVPSGCVWDASAVQSLRPVHVPIEPGREDWLPPLIGEPVHGAGAQRRRSGNVRRPR